MGGTSLMDFFLNIGINADTIKLRDLVSSIGELNLQSVLASLGLGEMYEGLKNVMTTGDKTALSIKQFTEATGLSGEKMQQFSKYAEQFGISQQEAVSMVSSFQDKISELNMSGAGANLLQMLKLDPNQDTFALMKNLSESLADPSIPDNYKKLLAEKLGLNNADIAALKMMHDQWDTMDQIRTVTDQETEAIMRNHQAWIKVEQSVNLLYTRLSADLSPITEKLFDGLSIALDLISDHIREISSALLNMVLGLNPLLQIKNLLMSLSGIFHELSNGAKEFYGWLSKIAGAMPTGQIAGFISHPFGLGMNNSNSGASTVIQNNNTTINAHTNADPKEIKRLIDERHTYHIQTAYLQSQNGGKGSI